MDWNRDDAPYSDDDSESDMGSMAAGVLEAAAIARTRPEYAAEGGCGDGDKWRSSAEVDALNIPLGKTPLLMGI